MSESQQTLASGFKLGFGLLGLFAISAVVSYLALGELGSAGVVQILIAAVLGPIVGSILFTIWWLFPKKTYENKDS